jgi:type II secretory pathway component PulF
MLAAGIPLVQAFEIVGNGHENAANAKAHPCRQVRCGRW